MVETVPRIIFEHAHISLCLSQIWKDKTTYHKPARYRKWVSTVDTIVSAKVFLSSRAVGIRIESSLRWQLPAEPSVCVCAYACARVCVITAYTPTHYLFTQPRTPTSVHPPSLSSRRTTASRMPSAWLNRTRRFLRRAAGGARAPIPPCWRRRLFSLS